MEKSHKKNILKQEWVLIKMPESFIATVQKLRRVVIPPNVFEVMGLKEGDKVRVTVEKMEVQEPLDSSEVKEETKP